MDFPDPVYDDFKKRNLRVLSGPAALSINSAGRCNLECHMCWHSTTKEIEIDLDVEKVDPFLQKAHLLLLLGGEPLWMTEKVNRKARDIFNRVIDGYPDIRISAFTNGVRLTDQMMDIVIRRFQDIYFSVDSVDPQVFEKVRSKPVLEKVLENIKRLNERKKKNGLGPNAPPFINMNSIVMQSSLDGLPAVAQKLSELGGRRHFLANLRNLVGPDFEEKYRQEKVDYTDIPENRIEPIRKELVKIYEKSGMDVEDQAKLLSMGHPPLPDPGGPGSVCHLPWTEAILSQNGDVRFCCANNMIFGNINRNGFEDIWNGSVAMRVRESFINGEMIGCMRDVCIAPVDYFSYGEKLYQENIMRSLQSEFIKKDEVDSVLLIRTAPMGLSRPAALALRRFFNGAKLTVVTNSQGVGECRKWSVNAEVIEYPQDFFSPEHFKGWWAGRRTRESYSLAAAVYSNGSGSGYENIEEIIRNINAERSIVLKPKGDLAVIS